tara:strand:- start:8592 stop:8888 length:297 start_codon:yes stop_codon:yes gene_type:complete
MEKIKKKKVKKTSPTKEEIFPLVEEARDIEGQEEADHVIDGYHVWGNNQRNNFNDDLNLDDNDYEIEQEKYAIQSEDTQPIAVDRYFERFGKSRRTPR